MKRMIALLLIACMLLGSAAFAEEAVTEKLFLDGLTGLLSRISLERDMVTLRADYENDTVFDASLKQQDKLVDIALTVAGTAIQAQISDTDITVAADGTTANLQYSDVEALWNRIMEIVSARQGDAALLQELALLFWETVIQPDLTIDQTAGLHVSYAATGKMLLERLSAFGDAVLTTEKYDALLEQLLGYVALLSRETMPSVAELKETWPTAKKDLAAMETDFEAAFELTVAENRIDAAAHLGDSSEQYETTWALDREGDEYALDGRLAQIKNDSEKTRISEIIVTGSLIGDGEANLWKLSIQAPSSLGFALTADGSATEKNGTVHFVLSNYYNRMYSFTLYANYAIDDDMFTAMAYIGPGRGTPFIADLQINEKQCNLSVNHYTGQKLLTLNLLADDHRQLRRAYLEYSQNPRDKFTLLYDGEKAVIESNGVTVTCTGAFESDHAYVITMHAEGEYVAPEEDTAFIRLEYAGEEGNFTVSGKVIAPDKTEPVAVELICKPTEPIDPILREQENVIHLTPDLLQTMLIPQ